MRRSTFHSILLGGLVGCGILVPITLFGAPGTTPKLAPGGTTKPGAAPITQPGLAFRLPANAKKATTKLVPRLPNAPVSTRVAGKPWLETLRPKCFVGSDCYMKTYEVPQRTAGQRAVPGVFLSFYEVGTSPTDTRLTPTVWSKSLMGFKPHANMHPAQRYAVLLRDAQGKALSNAVTFEIAAYPDPRQHPDFDQDGEPSIGAGGLDCDDTDNRRSPPRTEVGDLQDLDEDCESSTFGARDADRDGYPDASACNYQIAGSGLDSYLLWVCGSDCDDTKPAIKPGEMMCDTRDLSIIFVCKEQPSWSVDPRTTAGDGFFEPYPCDYFAPGARCVQQPNGRGVCQVMPQ